MCASVCESVVLCMKMYANWLLILSQIEGWSTSAPVSVPLPPPSPPPSPSPAQLQPHLRCHRQRQRQRHLSVARNEFKTEAAGILLCGLWQHWTDSCVE